MHVQSCCFANLNLLQPRSQGSVRENLGKRLNLLLFLSFSLPSPSPLSLLKLPILLCRERSQAFIVTGEKAARRKPTLYYEIAEKLPKSMPKVAFKIWKLIFLATDVD